MTVDDLEAARERWVRDRPEFERFVQLISSRCQGVAQSLGIWADISGRAKEVDSLIKKLIKKAEHSYDSLPDKAGIRVVVRYKDEIQLLIDALHREFHCLRTENKVDTLPANEFGYLSAHIDAQLLPQDSAAHAFPPGNFRVEIQVRTMAQHLWSEMSHDTFYKTDPSKIPLPLQRRLFALAGVVELADEEFTRVARAVPSSPEVEILRSLERHFYKYAAQRGDPELSVNVIQALLPIYGAEPATVTRHLDQFLTENAGFLKEFYAVQRASEGRSAYVFQPEALMVYDLLQDHKWDLRKIWDRHFPPRELDRLSNAFGITLD